MPYLKELLAKNVGEFDLLLFPLFRQKSEKIFTAFQTYIEAETMEKAKKPGARVNT
jgi:hypothetical protein